MPKIGANQPCPCGSGKKYKKCCGKPQARVGFLQSDRYTVLEKLSTLMAERFAREDDAAMEEFWLRDVDDLDELPPAYEEASEACCDMWTFCDRRLQNGRLPTEELLATDASLTTGQQLYLQELTASAQRLYEVVDTVAGASVTLRDALDGTVLTVREKAGSRTMTRHATIAARVVQRGSSGRPEMEAGVLHIPTMIAPSLCEHMRKLRTDFFVDLPDADALAFAKEGAPVFHQAWIDAILDPQIPELHNTDGESILWTKSVFAVQDAARVKDALDRDPRLGNGDGSDWSMTRESAGHGVISVGTVRLRDNELVLETNSAERDASARELLESLLGDAITLTASVHEDLSVALRDKLKAALRGEAPFEDEEPSGALPPELNEALVLDHLSKHYRDWVDQPVPALDGKTPRAAAKDPQARVKVEDLVRDLEGQYQHALKCGQPAYDPTWMWDELEIAHATTAKHPPPLAHERLDMLKPGTAELLTQMAERIRSSAGFCDRSTTASNAMLNEDIAAQRYLRTGVPRDDETAQNSDGEPTLDLRPHLRAMLSYELHRRKAFFVDEALSVMLLGTDVDVLGRELRVPFCAFALVFTNREVLSLAERLLAKSQDCKVAGQLLRVATVYVTEEGADEERILRMVFAFDTLGADVPHAVVHEIALTDDGNLQAHLDDVAPAQTASICTGGNDEEELTLPPPPLRGLLHAVINAVLYATSAGAQAGERPPPDPPPRRNPGEPEAPAFSSESVYHLPGTIDIRTVRQMQSLARDPRGRTMLRRYMVRGHWRRAAKSWTDQRLRWIQPYWKGPNIASVIERVYRLRQ